MLEGSKSFAKDVMRAAGVPTADAVRFGIAHADSALNYAVAHGAPVVIKADGLCGGKGAIVCQTEMDIRVAINRCFKAKEFGAAGEMILVEDFLAKHPMLPRAELSVLALVDFHGNFIMFPAAQDHKAVFDGDQGPNTGGMGSYAPVPWVKQTMMDVIGQDIFAPVIAEMQKRGTPFSGVLYAGLMWTFGGPKVVEFNVRFGDPEIQPLAMLLKTDLIPVLKKIADGESIADINLEWKPGAAVCVVMTSHGYPGSYPKGAEIIGLNHGSSGLDIGESLQVFQAGTAFDGEKIVTVGGRVLNVTSYSDYLPGAPGQDALSAARVAAYEAVGKISWKDNNDHGPQIRNDIAQNVPIIF
jgi:phosphoribosylamine--glycine ligase